MNLRSAMFLGCVLSITTPTLVQAASSPCTNDGQLKSWAKKYYDADYCSATTANSAPTVTITSPGNGATLEEGSIASVFSGNASDAEDGDLSNSIHWISSLNGTLKSATQLSVGTHTIIAEVQDSGGLTAKDTITVVVAAAAVEPVVVENSAPTVQITSPANGAELEEGVYASIFTAKASDVEDGDLSSSIHWISSLNGTLKSSTQLSVGTHKIIAEVQDSDSVTAKDTITVTVVAPKVNTAPTVSITAPGNGATLEEGVTGSVFSGQANDAEDGDISSNIQWISSLNGTLKSTTLLSVGTHTITAQVEDSESVSAKDSITVVVTAAVDETDTTAENTAPVVKITSPSNGATLQEGVYGSIFSASAIDAEDGALAKVQWISSLDGTLKSYTQLSVGTHKIIAEAKDSANLAGKDTITVIVAAAGESTETTPTEPAPTEPTPSENTAPTISITAPLDGDSAEVGTALLFKAAASDVEDGDLSQGVTWYSSLDGEIANLTTLSAGNHLITATVIDSANVATSDSIFLTIYESSTGSGDTFSYTLNWYAPTQRTDGSTLFSEEIAGYYINWKNGSNGTSGRVKVEGGLISSYELNDLEAGNYVFTLNTIDTTGIVSADSTSMTAELF